MNMNQRLAYGLVLALAGCSAPGGASLQAMPHCLERECKVLVKVDASCRLTVQPEHLYVPAGGETHVHWMIDPPSTDVVFDVNGIAFKPANNPGQFDQKQLQAQGKQFHWRDMNTLAGEFRYDVNVRNSQGELCHLDPYIHNQ
jgi:hypothetical protein